MNVAAAFTGAVLLTAGPHLVTIVEVVRAALPASRSSSSVWPLVAVTVGAHVVLGVAAMLFSRGS